MTEYLPEMWPLLAMVGAFVIGTFALKLPVSISLVIASVVGVAVWVTVAPGKRGAGVKRVGVVP